MSTVANKFIDIDDIEQTEIGPIYVINTTPAGNRSQVTFTVAKSSGNGLDTVMVPAIKLPIDLTAQVTKRQLIASSEFRRAISMGFIQPITKEYYNELMNLVPDARSIIIRELRNMTRAPDEQSQEQTDADDDFSRKDATSGVSPKYLIIAERLKAGEISERSLIIDIKTNGDLTRNDAVYLWKETKDTQFSALRNYLQELRTENNW